VRRRPLYIGVRELNRAGFSDQHRAAMNVVEVAIRKAETMLPAFGLFIILAQMPSSNSARPCVSMNLLAALRARLMIGPVTALIEHA
jgi:hypothetical protein